MNLRIEDKMKKRKRTTRYAFATPEVSKLTRQQQEHCDDEAKVVCCTVTMYIEDGMERENATLKIVPITDLSGHQNSHDCNTPGEANGRNQSTVLHNLCISSGSYLPRSRKMLPRKCKFLL